MSFSVLPKSSRFSNRAGWLSLTTGRSIMTPASRRGLVTGGPKEFLCIMPDNPNMLEIRKKVKELHYQGIKPLIESGKLVAGGAIFETHPEEGKQPPFKGSVVVYTGDSVESVRQIVENDVYATSGVWDLTKVQIIPYVPAVRKPLV